jgi:tripartite-type tricarboxylate transporter receptor subunit TctC
MDRRCSVSRSMKISAKTLAGLSYITVAGWQAVALAAAYPERPVRLVVAYAAGSNADLSARKVAAKLALAPGQQLTIDNRPGASGIIGTDVVAKSPNDGYTLLWGTAQAMVTNVHLFTKLPYDPIRDFAPIARMGTHPHFFVVPLNVPVNSIAELIAYAKARPGQLNYPSSGNGTNAHLSGALFAYVSGLEVSHVPYNNAGALIADLVSGRTQFMSYSYPPLSAMIKAGKLKVLATTGARRSDLFPDIPTMIEAGVPDFVITGWEGIFAPSGAAKDIVTKVYAAAAQALKDPDVVVDIKSDGGAPALANPDEFFTFMRTELERYRKIVAISGAKAE